MIADCKINDFYIFVKLNEPADGLPSEPPDEPPNELPDEPQNKNVRI